MVDSDEEYATCPYNKQHRFAKRQLGYHLARCAEKNVVGHLFETCRHNTLHRVRKEQLREHEKNCRDRPKDDNNKLTCYAVDDRIEKDREKKDFEQYTRTKSTKPFLTYDKDDSRSQKYDTSQQRDEKKNSSSRRDRQRSQSQDNSYKQRKHRSPSSGRAYHDRERRDKYSRRQQIDSFDRKRDNSRSLSSEILKSPRRHHESSREIERQRRKESGNLIDDKRGLKDSHIVQTVMGWNTLYAEKKAQQASQSRSRSREKKNKKKEVLQQAHQKPPKNCILEDCADCIKILKHCKTCYSDERVQKLLQFCQVDLKIFGKIAKIAEEKSENRGHNYK